MVKKLICVIAAFALAAACVFIAASVSSVSVGAPQHIDAASPCPATGCASGECHDYANVPGPDGVPVPAAMPRALAADELPLVAEQHAQAARNARAAGIDAVELHCSSGYLINSFLNPASNKREDAFGGSPENRARFPIMVVKAMAEAVGADRVGVRISPGNPYNGMDPTDPGPVFAALLDGIDDLDLAYLHVLDTYRPGFDTIAFVRQHWSGPVAINNMLTLDKARALLAGGQVEGVSFGRAFIGNPDLVARFRTGAPLAEARQEHFYTGEEVGYTDYPPFTAA